MTSIVNLQCCGIYLSAVPRFSGLRGGALQLLHEAIKDSAVFVGHRRRGIVRHESSLERGDRGVQIPCVISERLQEESRVEIRRNDRIRWVAPQPESVLCEPLPGK